MRKDYQDAIDTAVTEHHLSAEAAANLKPWLGPGFEEFHEELHDLLERGAWSDLEDAFYTLIPFGTGGRRGQRGVGTNRINRRTIGESAQGLCTYLRKTLDEAGLTGVVIAHDTRHMSREFAEECACIIAANGIQAYLFDDYRSTPELSYAIRHLGTAAGIMISASHNPPEDNGIKVSWADGGQVLPPHDKGIIDEVKAVTTIKRVALQDGIDQGTITLVGAEVDDPYLADNATLSRTTPSSASFTFTPLHGVGGTNVLELLRHLGYAVATVDAQMTPDGDFTHVQGQNPNPEYPSALREVIDLARERKADAAFAADPDADRLGAAIPVPTWVDDSGWLALTGNQIGMLASAFLLEKGQHMGSLSSNHLLVKTCVTTEFLTALGRKYGVKVTGNLLVGFKYIAEIIEGLDDPSRFLFGMEESHGYLAGTWVRDKDAAHAGLLLAELASELKGRGSSLWQKLLDLYREYGVFLEHTESIYHRGKEGAATIARMLGVLRSKPPRDVGGVRVHRVIDRLAGVAFTPEAPDKRYPYDGTKGNVIILEFSEDGWNRLTIRPSGTEPKVKIYAQSHLSIAADLDDQAVWGRLAQLKEDAKARIAALQEAVQ